MVRNSFNLLAAWHILPCFSSIFTIVPEKQYIYLNHNVTFECATNLTGYTLTFSYGGAVDATVKEASLPDGGVKVTTTFIVTHSLNGTSVRCHADDDMNPLISTSKVYAYTQGPPGAVYDLQGYQLDRCCIVFSWFPPFTLGQLSVWYQVTLCKGEEVMLSEVIYTTNYTYCPIDLTNGEYRLNITTINGAGTGIESNIVVMFTTVNKIVVFFKKTNVIRAQQYWTFHFMLSVNQLCTIPLVEVTVTSCDVHNNCFSASSLQANMTISNGNITADMKLDSYKHYNTIIYIDYGNRTFMTDVFTTSTHDLLDLSIINISDNSLCLQYNFIIGSETCLVHLYIEDTTTILHYDIPRHNMLYFNHCISDIPTGNNWTISACDEPLDNASCHNPAVILYGVNIVNEISSETCIPSSQDGVITPTSMTLTTHTIISTEILIVTQCTTTNNTSVTIQSNDLTNDAMTSFYVSVTVITFIMMISLLGNIVIITIYCRHKYRKSQRTTNEVTVDHEMSPIEAVTGPQYENVDPIKLKECPAYAMIPVIQEHH